jgi:class 3 adenylate cyclase
MRAASVTVQLTLTPQDVPSADHGPRRSFPCANRRAERAASRRSTTSHPGARSRHVYVDVQDKRTSNKQIAATLHVAVSGADRGITPRDQGATADVTLASSKRDSGRFLTTVLMTDIVDSTQTVARLGDERWRRVLAQHYADCRAQVDHAGGRLVNTTGDGILAIFDAPRRAVRAAIAIQAAARASGLAVRAGVHTGECARLADGLAGLAVHVAARICALGNADEVMASTTVRDFATDSMLSFEPQGRHELKGVPGEWTVFKADLAIGGFRRETAVRPTFAR